MLQQYPDRMGKIEICQSLAVSPTSFLMNCYNVEKAYKFVTFFPKRKILEDIDKSHFLWKIKEAAKLSSSQSKGIKTSLHLFTMCTPAGDFSLPWWSCVICWSEKGHMMLSVAFFSGPYHQEDGANKQQKPCVNDRSICVTRPLNKCPLNFRGFSLLLKNTSIGSICPI